MNLMDYRGIYYVNFLLNENVILTKHSLSNVLKIYCVGWSEVLKMSTFSVESTYKRRGPGRDYKEI